MPYPRYSGGSTGGGGGGYGGTGGRGYSSSSSSNVNPWQQGHGGQMTSGNKVDPLTLMGSLMGAMMGGGGGGGQMASSNPLHQLAGLAMASAINTGGVGPDRGGRGGYDRDRRERQVGDWFDFIYNINNILALLKQSSNSSGSVIDHDKFMNIFPSMTIIMMDSHDHLPKDNHDIILCRETEEDPLLAEIFEVEAEAEIEDIREDLLATVPEELDHLRKGNFIIGADQSQL